ncbi:MAG: hypothetical protein MUF63_15050 [Rhodobacteraceae bacterium]|jgi:hypothetical protein|nr:hypothetical protein [Paracoccaceae bacterium]
MISRAAIAVPTALLLGACTISETPPATLPTAPIPPADVPLFGPGYRAEGDSCRRAGESAFTNQFLSDAADLVACPPGTDPGLFAFETGGREVARTDGWILFTVPRR